jgi:hypothetical protein
MANITVTKKGDSLFGKVFKVLRSDAQHVVAEITTEVGKLEALFHRSSVEETASHAPDPEPVATVPTADVEASDVALKTAEPNEAETVEPAIPLPAPDAAKEDGEDDAPPVNAHGSDQAGTAPVPVGQTPNASVPLGGPAPGTSPKTMVDNSPAN